MDAERIAKLPKWAQQYVGKLERDVEWYKEQLRQTSSGDSRIAWELGAGRRLKWQGIPERATIRFQLENGRIECTLRDGAVRVHGHSRGRLVVKPEAANLAVLEFKDRD